MQQGTGSPQRAQSRQERTSGTDSGWQGRHNFASSHAPRGTCASSHKPFEDTPVAVAAAVVVVALAEAEEAVVARVAVP